MATRRRRSGLEMNLDSLTDIMANTVGIMVFVMIFAVIAARGSFVRKRLPMEHSTAKQRCIYLCAGNTVRVYPVDRMVDPFVERLKRLQRAGSYEGIARVVAELNALSLQDEGFRATGAFHYSQNDWFGVWGTERSRTLDYGYVVIAPLPGTAGESPKELQAPYGNCRRSLAALEKTRHWVLFLVDPSSIEAFEKARDMAREQGLETGWVPYSVVWPDRLSLLGEQRPGKPPLPD